MKVLLKLLDGVNFLTQESQFSTILYPAHKHKDTGLEIEEVCQLNCQIGKFRISSKSFAHLSQSSLGDATIEVNEIENLPEWVLCGYATREELDSKKSEVLEEQRQKALKDKELQKKMRAEKKKAMVEEKKNQAKAMAKNFVKIKAEKKKKK